MILKAIMAVLTCCHMYALKSFTLSNHVIPIEITYLTIVQLVAYVFLEAWLLPARLIFVQGLCLLLILLL